MQQADSNEGATSVSRVCQKEPCEEGERRRRRGRRKLKKKEEVVEDEEEAARRRRRGTIKSIITYNVTMHNAYESKKTS
jgi:hypothetical protein